jgi:glutathione synthase/RimK-type ligase-like ATP-grasp enzyme
MNLEFAAVDLLQTLDDEIVFLEINPNGRWLWIEEQTGMDISKDIGLHLAYARTLS